MQYVFILGLVFACIFFLVMVILSAKTWRWLHVVATLFVFAMAVMYTAFVAISSKTRNAWKERAQINEQKVMDLEQAIDDLTIGPTDGIRFGDVSIKHLRLMKEREILGRGRVWREIGPATNVAQDWSQVALSTVPRSAASP